MLRLIDLTTGLSVFQYAEKLFIAIMGNGAPSSGYYDLIMMVGSSTYISFILSCCTERISVIRVNEFLMAIMAMNDDVNGTRHLPLKNYIKPIVTAISDIFKG